MKKITLGMILMGMMLFGFDIKVTAIDIPNSKGKIYIGLFNKAQGFREVNKTFKQMSMQIDSSRVSYTFHNIPKGTYAISIFHDANNNGKLDTNFLGIPKEAYGFSHNIRHIMRATSYNEAKFVLGKDQEFIIKVGK